MTKEDGRTADIPLYVDESQIAGYEIDIRAKHFCSRHVVLPLYPGVHSDLLVCMLPEAKTPCKAIAPVCCKLHESRTSAVSLDAFLYALRYLNPTLPAELLRRRAEDIWKQLSKETGQDPMPSCLLLHQRVCTLAEDIYRKHTTPAPDAAASSSLTQEQSRQWLRFITSCIPICEKADSHTATDILCRQLHVSNMQADNAAADDKIFRRQAALQALVNSLPKEPAQLTPWEAWKALLQSTKGCYQILKLFYGECQLLEWLTEIQKDKTALSAPEWKQLLKKEAEGLCHMLQDQDILKREPPVSTCSDIRMQLQAVLKAYHCKQDDTSFSKNVCEFQRLLGLPIDGRLHDRDCRLLQEISSELNIPPI